MLQCGFPITMWSGTATLLTINLDSEGEHHRLPRLTPVPLTDIARDVCIKGENCPLPPALNCSGPGQLHTYGLILDTWYRDAGENFWCIKASKLRFFKKGRKLEKESKTPKRRGCITFTDVALCSQVFHVTDVTPMCVNLCSKFPQKQRNFSEKKDLDNRDSIHVKRRINSYLWTC